MKLVCVKENSMSKMKLFSIAMIVGMIVFGSGCEREIITQEECPPELWTGLNGGYCMWWDIE